MTTNIDALSRPKGLSLRIAGVLLMLSGFALFMFRYQVTSIAGRGLIGLAVLLALGVRQIKLDRLQRRWMTFTLMFFAGLIVSAVVVLNTSTLTSEFKTEIFLDVPRQAFMLLATWAIFVHLRTRRPRQVFSFGMAVLGLLNALLILGAYVRYAGFSLSRDLVDFKAAAHYDFGVDVNPVSFTAVLGLVVGWPWLSSRKWLATIAVTVCAAALYLSASRATQGALAGGLLLATLVTLWHRARGLVRFLMLVVALLLVTGMGWIAITDTTVGTSNLSAVTTGRLDLWTASVAQFMEKPWAGWGAKSYRNISAYIPDYYEWGSESLEEAAEAGGYHQAYLGLLAQHGVVGFVPGVLMLWALWTAVSRGSRRRIEMVGHVFLCSVLLRGMAEQAGFFGAADGLVDFMVFASAAFFVAAETEGSPDGEPRMALRGDHARGSVAEATRASI